MAKIKKIHKEYIVWCVFCITVSGPREVVRKHDRVG